MKLLKSEMLLCFFLSLDFSFNTPSFLVAEKNSKLTGRKCRERERERKEKREDDDEEMQFGCERGRERIF